MRYYLDCEFNGMGGELLSLALVREDGKALYLIAKMYPSLALRMDPWVKTNVLPIMALGIEIVRSPLVRYHTDLFVTEFAEKIEGLLRDDTDITIITDWPDDIKYFCELILTGPGTMIEVRPSIKFEMHRVDAYPTTLPGAIQHNAYWDAMALRHKLQTDDQRQRGNEP